MSLLETNEFIYQQGAILKEADENLIQTQHSFVVLDNHRMEHKLMQGITYFLYREFIFYTLTGEEIAVIKRKTAKFTAKNFGFWQNGTEIMRVYGDFIEHEYQF